MKQLLFTIILAISVTMLIQAQTDVTLNIKHKLDDADFTLNTASSNNLNETFNITRLQYYISEITVVHDGGQETSITDTWALINTAQANMASINLGNIAVTSLESIKLNIGVDPGHNHDNPADYATGHPLAPTLPSMHWGWAAGYRFVALEGKGGEDLSQTYEFHGLGDNYYFETEIAVTGTAENNLLEINLDADYARALENINVASGPIVHGDFGDAVTVLENFRDFVFSETAATSPSIDIKEISNFNVFPNPSTDGNVSMSVEATGGLDYEVSIVDILGKEITHFDEIRNGETLEFKLETAGCYFVNLIKNGVAVINRKLIIQ